jgi:hypothetical protein
MTTKWIVNNIIDHITGITTIIMGVIILVLGSVLLSKSEMNKKQFKTIELIQPEYKSFYHRDTLIIETITENDSTLFIYTNKNITIILKK